MQHKITAAAEIDISCVDIYHVTQFESLCAHFRD